jgi:murein DD-endopeptidase MepM/ murein hydrolase activator NlpD
MPEAARSIWSMRRRACLGVAVITVLAALVILADPFVSRASATTVPIVFPLEKRVTIRHDYLAPRVGHLHQGTDLMAAKMTREMACVSGTVYLREGTYGGVPSYSLWLAGDDGHGYFYIHINNDTPGTDDGAGGYQYAFAPGLTNGFRVTQGQFIAYVGDSGNAESTGSHLHFEIHETTSMSSPSMDPYDSLAAAPLYDGTPPSAPPTPGAARYEQTNSNILYLGTWVTFTSSSASGGSYKYANSPARAIISFTGTKLDLIATKGTTQGKAQVYLDGADKGVIDFSSTTTLRKQVVWSTGTVTSGKHTVELSWLGKPGVAGGTRINIDAVDVLGTLAPVALTTVEQTDSRFSYKGIWTTLTTASASGGSTVYVNKAGSSVTIDFTGSCLIWLAKTASVYGIAKVTVDGGTPVLVDLYSASTLYKQKVWNTGLLADGAHTVVIEWTGTKNARSTKTNIGIDAVQVLGPSD